MRTEGSTFYNSFEYCALHCDVNLWLIFFQDGAVYAIIPDCPLIEYPINQTMEFMAVIYSAKYIAGYFNIELFTYKHFLAITLGMMFFVYYVFSNLLSWMF